MDQSFIFGNQRIAWTKMGEGPPLVLVHGTPFSSQVWRKIAPLLAGRWTVYLFDLLGYGKSEQRPGQDVSLGVQNRVLAALFSEWGLDRPDVLAHDFGGATALRGYFLDGLRFRSLTLFDVVALAPWGSPFVRHARAFEPAFSGLPGYMHDALLAAYLRGAAYRELSAEVLDVYMSPWRGRDGQSAFYRQIAQMDQCYTDEIEHLYRPLDCPVSILWGQKDEWLPIEQGYALASRLSCNPVIPIQNAGHLVQEDAPEAIVAAMLLQASSGPL